MDQNKSFEDRRQDPRLEGNIPLKISSGEFDAVTETKNLSRSGAFCRVDQYIEPMTKLKIHLLLPFKRNGKVITKKVTCQGVVVRTEAVSDQESFNVAIFFNDIQERNAEYIAEYVNANMENDTSS